VTHIGSGFANEIESSLDILLVLVENHIYQMAPFAIFVKVGHFFIINISYQLYIFDRNSCQNSKLQGHCMVPDIDMTRRNAWLLPVEHMQQTTCLHLVHLVLSAAAASICLLLYLKPAVHFFHIFSQAFLSPSSSVLCTLWQFNYHFFSPRVPFSSPELL